MNIKIIKSPSMDENCYLIINGNQGILIDPGEDTIKILKSSEGITVKYILLTHCHFDHIYSLSELKGKKTVLGSENIIGNMNNRDVTLMPYNENLGDKVDGFFKDGEIKNLCGLNVQCIYTKGHTDCSVCYVIENCVFSGDTLFFESVGRWDFKTGDFCALENSIRKRLYSLPDETVVYPGHGKSTTIGYEKKYGFFKEEK